MAVASGGRAVVGIRVPGHPPILEAYLDGQKVWDGHVNQIKQVPYAVATASAEAPVVRRAAARPPPRALGYAEAISGADVSTGAMIAAPVMAATATAPTPDTIREHFFEIVAPLEMTAQAYAPEGGASAGVLLFPDAAEGSAVANPADPSAHAAVTVPMAGPANVDVYAPSAAMVFIADPNTATATAMARVPVVSGAQILTAPLSTATAVDYAPDVVADSMPEVPAATATGAAPVPTVLAGEGEGINPPVATAAAAAPVPDNVGGSSTVIAMLSLATAEDAVPTVTASSNIAAAVGTAAASCGAPDLITDQIQTAPVVTAVATAPAPSAAMHWADVAPTAAATAAAPTPAVGDVTQAVDGGAAASVGTGTSLDGGSAATIGTGSQDGGTAVAP